MLALRGLFVKFQARAASGALLTEKGTVPPLELIAFRFYGRQGMRAHVLGVRIDGNVLAG